jgi:hypothetical protein
MTMLAEKSKMTVDSLIAARHEPRTYEEKVRHALNVIEMHLQEENPDRIDECIRLYTDNAVWEAPARKVSYQGRGCSMTPMQVSRSPATHSRIAHIRSEPRCRCA